MAARALPDRRLGLLGNRYAIHWQGGGGTERRELENEDAIAEVLEKDFGIEIPDPAAFLETARSKIFAEAPR